MKALTKNTFKKYKLVVDEWFNNEFNGKQAYLKYYKNVKDDTASTNFSKIQQFPEIKEYIQSKYDLINSKTEMQQEDIVRNLEGFANLDITDIMTYTDVECQGSRMVSNPDYDKEDPKSKKQIEENFTYLRRELVIKDFKDLTDIQRKAIKSVKYGKFGLEIEFFGKERAYDMLNRHKGVYEVDNKQKAAVINITATNDKHKNLIDGIINGEN